MSDNGTPLQIHHEDEIRQSEPLVTISNKIPSTTPILEPFRILLKDGMTNATIYPIYSPNELPSSLLEFLWDEYNMEIEKGQTLSFFNPLSFDEFIHHWFTNTFVVAIMIVGDEPPDLTNDARVWPSELLGIFNIKQNYPGERSSHICTGEFLVNAGIRGRGIGKTLTDCFLQWCDKIGYKYVVFNVVLETNVAARKLWESLNFQRIGRIDNVAYMGNDNESVDGIIYGKTIVDTNNNGNYNYNYNYNGNKQVNSKSLRSINSDDIDSHNLKFENLRYYLKTGNYPENADNKEKSRLRANKATYYLDTERNNALMVNGREVITSIKEQLGLCQEIHEENGHLGINRTTTLVSQKYHWVRIKETVAKVLRSCQECKNNSLQAKDDFLNQSNNKRIKLLQSALETQQREQEQLEALVAQVKQRLMIKSGISYADAARSAFLKEPENHENNNNNNNIHSEVNTYSKNDGDNDDEDTLATSVRTYHH